LNKDINSNQDELRAQLNRIYLQSNFSLGSFSREIKISTGVLSRFLKGGLVKYDQLKKIIYYVQKKRDQLDNPFDPLGPSRD
jgi:hypothetical protein